MAQRKIDPETGRVIASEGTQDPTTGVIHAPWTGPVYEQPALGMTEQQKKIGALPEGAYLNPAGGVSYQEGYSAPITGLSVAPGTQLSPTDQYQQAVKPLIEGYATSVDFYQKQQTQLENLRQEQRKMIERQYQQEKTGLEERGAQEMGGAKAQAGRFGGLGFDTAQQGYLASVQKQSDERLASLNKSKQDALATADFQAFDRYQQLADKELARQDKLAELKINMLTKAFEMQTEQKKYNTDMAFKEKQFEQQQLEFQTGEERAQQEFGLKQKLAQQELTQQDIENVTKQISSFAQALVPLEQINSNNRTVFETVMGLPDGTFESYYSGLLYEAKQGQQLNDLKVKQIQADINNTYSQIKERGTVKAELLSVAEAQSLGVPYGTTKSEAVKLGITPQKPATEAQETDARTAVRLEQAEPTLKSLEQKIVKLNPASFEAQLTLPSYLQSSDFQQYMQSARNFINANLRKESGAVISPTEFQEARQQYLPQAGDKPETLKLKENNRKLIFEKYKKSAGSAYSSVGELLGKENVFTSSKGGTGQTSSGLKWTIE